MTNPRELIELLRKHRNQLGINVTVLHFYEYAKLYATGKDELEKMLPIILLLGLEIHDPLSEIHPGEFQITVKLD